MWAAMEMSTMQMLHTSGSNACSHLAWSQIHALKGGRESPLPSAQLRISGWHQTAGSSACPAEVVPAVLGKTKKKKKDWLAGL